MAKREQSHSGPRPREGQAEAPIESHGLIGDLRTAALVTDHGTIDWLCWPRFDSPTVFAALLDADQGGHFRIGCTSEETVTRQSYWAQTNVLVTRFYSEQGVGEVLDFMVVHDGGKSMDTPRRLIRHVRAARGKVNFELVCRPAFNYARTPHTLTLDDKGALFETDELSLRLTSPDRLKDDGKDGVILRFTLEAGEEKVFCLQPPELEVLDQTSSTRLFNETVRYWRHWLDQCTYHGRWRELVERSALTLKLMIYAPTGAIIAAPTTSLPEFMGGTRNWDYRYTWLRDAAFTLYALIRIGFVEEASQFMRWLEGRIREGPGDGRLPIMFRVDGDAPLTEENLEHLSGYNGSRPVRIGNHAVHQQQLDIYGELMDSVYLSNKYGEPISYAFWSHLRRSINYVCDHWREADQGIWEMRGPAQHFVSSKLQCWVALDRGIRLADKRSFPAERERWLKERDAIYESIMNEGFDEKRGAFMQAYGSDSLDASNLLMPLMFFVAPTDPRMLSTLEAISTPASKGGLSDDGLIYRYDAEAAQDGIDAEGEGTFNLCTFWCVEAYTRAGRTEPRLLDYARQLFERMHGYSNHVGLYGEQVGPRGEALGNFPQALTHLSLISAAVNLDRALGRHD
ncbi:MAG TPA: glycoside hydrolase family 15 protein [Myxococcaceae bacterium]|nr:glycoside hydrolase family 15 protein [Myxococcaceae bacterium]